MTSKASRRDNASNIKKKEDAQRKLHAKVEQLRKFDIEGVPAGASVPTSMNELRLWECPVLKLEKIGSSGTTSRKEAPHNVDLIDEAETLITGLKKKARSLRRAPYTPLEQQLRKKDSELKEAKLLIARLTSQYQAIFMALETMRTDLQSARTNERIAKEQLGTTRKALIDAERKLGSRLREVK